MRLTAVATPLVLFSLCSLGAAEGCGEDSTSSPSESEPSATESPAASPDEGGAAKPTRVARTRDPEPDETRLGPLVQLTETGHNVEPTFSGEDVVFVSRRGPDDCERLWRSAADGLSEPSTFGPDRGRVISPSVAGKSLVYAWAEDSACTPATAGSVWRFDAGFDLHGDADPPRALVTRPGYDAEVDLSADGSSIVFTSMVDGDPEVWIAPTDSADDARRLTRARGLDGGARFGPQDEWIYWRANRPEGPHELAAYRKLISDGEVVPVPTELWRMRRDGNDAERLTHDDRLAFSIAPHPDGVTLAFASNRRNDGSAEGSEFELWTLDLESRAITRITHSPGFDAYPRFSPDGRSIAFASSRGEHPAGETHIYVAPWRDALGDDATP